MLLAGSFLVLPTVQPLNSQAIPFVQRTFDAQVLRPSGQPVVPIYDGWYPNADGTFMLCYSYFNLNTEQSLDIPLGAANRLEPAQYDGGQPTFFNPVPNPKKTQRYRKQWCVFTIQVPADFEGDVVWTLATGQDTLSAPGRLHPYYVMEELQSSGRNVIAPGLKFAESDAYSQGRIGVKAGPLMASVDRPLAITAWVDPDPSDLLTWIGWTKHQGPGEVVFSDDELLVEKSGPATTQVTFSAPGEYVLRAQAINNPRQPNNPTGSFEFHCCWTNGFVRVSVR